MKIIKDWHFHGLSAIGTFPDDKVKRTSSIVSREGAVITTQSGSIYKLEPEPTKDQFKHLDDIIKVSNEPTE